MNEITVAQAAAMLGVSTAMVCRYLRQGRLLGRRIGKQMWLVNKFSVEQLVRKPRGNPKWRKGK